MKLNNRRFVFFQRSDELNCKLMACLEGALILGIKQQKRDVLQKTLRTFFLLDQCKFAINLICIRLVHPAFASILNEYSLRKDPQDLNGLLYKAKEFIEYQLKDLLDISEKYFSFSNVKYSGFLILIFLSDCTAQMNSTWSGIVCGQNSMLLWSNIWTAFSHKEILICFTKYKMFSVAVYILL